MQQNSLAGNCAPNVRSLSRPRRARAGKDEERVGLRCAAFQACVEALWKSEKHGLFFPKPCGAASWTASPMLR
eukprot:4765289-Pyramimonas_sp.AAC.1